jgi:hypothetical protein
VTRIEWNSCLGWEIFKIESKKMRDICYLKFGNTVKSGNWFLHSYRNLRKQVSLICLFLILKISHPKHGFGFILVTLY